MEKTEWYPANTRPVHIGVYEVQAPLLRYEDGWMRYWNGEYWTSGSRNTHRNWHEQTQKNGKAAFQDCQWRGLKENPHAD